MNKLAIIKSKCVCKFIYRTLTASCVSYIIYTISYSVFIAFCDYVLLFWQIKVLVRLITMISSVSLYVSHPITATTHE